MDPAWKMLLMVVAGLAAIVALGMCSGCAQLNAYKATFISGAGTFYDSQMEDSQHWLCDWSSAAATQRFWSQYPQEVHDGLCRKSWVKACETPEE